MSTDGRTGGGSAGTRPADGRHAPVPLAGPRGLDGGRLELPAGRYDWLHLRFRADEGATVTWWLHYATGADPESVHVPAGESVAVRVPVARRAELRAVGLPEHPALTLLAVTAIRPPATRRNTHEADELVTT